MADPVEEINDLARHVMAGGDLTKEQMRHALDMLRGNRSKATTSRAARAAKPTNIPKDLNELFKPKAVG